MTHTNDVHYADSADLSDSIRM